MKFLGKILHPKDVTTKEYVDEKIKEVEDKKVNTEDIEEYTVEEVNSIWESVFNNKI